jgi:alginate O-acetyltransferase complex protein AlgJ
VLIERQQTSRSWVHRSLITIGFLALFWPAGTTNLFGDGLTGYEPDSPRPELSLSAWFEGEFQSAADQWWKERFGMRFFFVKLDNQIYYWLTGAPGSDSDQLVYGEQGWLYERGYVDGYCGVRDRTEEAVVRELLESIRRLQIAMDKRGVPLVLLIAPSKAAVYPEWIPDELCTPHDGEGTEYQSFRPLLDEYGLRYVDGYTQTEDAKALWPGITLFPRGGTHWNFLGAYYSAEALLDSVRGESGLEIPPLELGNVTFDENAQGFDRDLVDFQNLFFPDATYPVSHPEFHMSKGEGGGVKIVLVGTSFLSQISTIYARSNGFDQVDHYWYYEHEIRDELTKEVTPLDRERIDWEDRILEADLVVLDMNMLAFQGEHIKRFVSDGLARLTESSVEAE